MCLALSMVVSSAWADGQNMLGRQSQNEGMAAVPAPGAVRVDGKLDDWDFSGRIWMFADKDVRSRFSGQVAAMWDRDALYLAVKWADPTPMFNMVNPQFNPNEGWKSDSVQLRLRSADQTMWITTWYYTPKRQPVMHLAVWKDARSHRNGTSESLLVAEPGQTALGQGAELAYHADDDGKGFVQEMRLPWAMLFKSVPAIEANLTLRAGVELLWGDPTGEAFPIHRYADNLQPGVTTREFFWSAHNAWGDLKLVARGNLEPRQYVSDERRVEGTTPVRVTAPRDAVRLTVAINDTQGRRVRNLAADIAPEDYARGDAGHDRAVEVMWDLLDDNGQLVPAGQYEAVGLTHTGLGAEYEMCFYNPGTPPWETQDGRGAWGADHTAPYRVTPAGDWMIVSWQFAEGGSGIIALGPDGLKRWGEKRGGRFIAADDQHVYAVPAGWHITEHAIVRLGRDKGDYRPFVLNGQERPLELPIAQILGADTFEPAGLTCTPEHLLLLVNAKAGDVSRLVWLDKKSAAVVKSADLPPMTGIAAGAGGVIYAMDATALYRIGADGKATKLAAASLAKPAALSVDGQGHALVADAGPDMQVKAFAADGKLVYTCGKKGGRPIRGAFDRQAMLKMTSVAADATGNVWVVESWNFPRRVSVWSPGDGKLVRDYIGNTGYAGTGALLHDQQPNLAYVGPIELELNKADRTWQVKSVLWVPDEQKGETFFLDTSEHVGGQRFTATVRGRTQEYFFVAPYRDYQGYVVLMPRSGGWQPVSAITTVGRLFESFGRNGAVEKPPTGEFADCNAFDAVFWNDANRDAVVQRSECEIIKSTKPGTDKRRGEIPIPMGSGWGQRCAPDLSFYVNGIHRYTPVDYTDDGAPIYTSKSVSPKIDDDRGDFVPVSEENLLLVLSFKGNPKASRVAGLDATTGAVRWTYPNLYPGVHGSHRAPMPTPGTVIGPLKICGYADIGPNVGRIFLMRGNLGQDFLMTTDGLYVGAMFQDGRLPAEKLPAREQELAGKPMEVFSHGAEPFNGWFGKQSDGVVRMTTGFPRQAAMILRLNGLQNVRRIQPVKLAVNDEMRAQADRDNLARATRSAPEKRYVVTAVPQSPRIDGNAGDWGDQPGLSIDRVGYPFKAVGRIAYDKANLYLLYEVEDSTPWRNEGKDFTRLFKTGDAVDLQLCVDAQQADPKRREPGAADVRVLLSQVNGKPAVVLMKPIDPGAGANLGVKYQSPVTVKSYDRVELMSDAVAAVRKSDNGYVLEASIPLARLGLKPQPGLTLRGDLGFISSDSTGMINAARTYWSNKDTNLVSDLPHEAWMTPSSWGTIVFE
jgi:hypothetical protein